MNIPNFENVPVISKGGYLSDTWSLILQQLISELQTNLSNEGYQVPQLPTTSLTGPSINGLQTIYAASPNPAEFYGNLLYDSTTNELKVNIAGTFKVVQVV